MTAIQSILLLLLISLPLGTAAAQDSAVVEHVLAGPILRMTDGRMIALVGITMPRSSAVSDLDVVQYIEKMVRGRRVMILAADTARRRDSSFAAFVLLDKKLVNLELLREGYAATDINAHHPYITQFQSALSTAKLNRLGAWSDQRARTVQCSHTEPDGTRCNEMTNNKSGRCFKHQ